MPLAWGIKLTTCWNSYSKQECLILKTLGCSAQIRGAGVSDVYINKGIFAGKAGKVFAGPTVNLTTQIWLVDPIYKLFYILP